MKKFLFCAICMSLFFAGMTAKNNTGVKIQYTNGKVTFIPSEDVEFVEFLNEEYEEVELTDNIKNLSPDTHLEATAVVTAISSRGLILTDKGGSILYYNQDFDRGLYRIGTVVNVSGQVIDYSNWAQLTFQATLDIVGFMDVTYPEPVDFTPQMITSDSQNPSFKTATYGKVTGQILTIRTYADKKRSYTFQIPGTDIMGLLYFPSEIIDSEIDVRETYTLVGYFLNYSSELVNGEYVPYFNILVTSVEPYSGN